MEKLFVFTLILVSFFIIVSAITDPNDAKVLNDFRNGLENPEVLRWPKGDDPCGPPKWEYVGCSNGRVTQIQTKNLGLKGYLPRDFNKLVKLQNVALQNNFLSGDLPSFSGLSNLQSAYLGNNSFETIPSDFFSGLSSLRVLAMDGNPFNATSGWSIPSGVGELSQQMNFSCSSCNIVGRIPDQFGALTSLSSLRLGSNKLSGEIPATFRNSKLRVLWLDDQAGGGLSGSIDLIGTMTGLTSLWLHGNQFTGPIPEEIGTLTSLSDLNLNRNRLVGLIPPALANMNLKTLKLDNNMFMGSIPYFKAATASFYDNSFCQPRPGEKCAPEVNSLLDFLRDINYPPILAGQWIGNDPCIGSWRGTTCSPNGKVTVINLQKLNLNGTISPSLVQLDSLLEVHIGGNNLHGRIPEILTELKNLKLLDLTGNNLEPPIPNFSSTVKLIIDGNLKITGEEESSGSRGRDNGTPSSTRSDHTLVIMVSVGSALAVILGFLLFFFIKKKKINASDVKVNPQYSPESSNIVKISVSEDSVININTLNTSGSKHGGNSRQLEDGNPAYSVQILRKVTDNFAEENELGRGGFGAVYKGELDNGTQIAVKRMEVGVVNNKALNEFAAEISVLSQVRHRHLVSLLGFAVEGNERLLVYEYMPEGALSSYLFHWKCRNLEPLSWRQRLIIALDVARGMEYLHSMTHQSFIHRDLKSSNILLSHDFRAKVADFGLVKLAPDADKSLQTALAGTFGYLAPEYAVTGKITTKVDVFSFGVVLIELLTGLKALDEQRSEESRYLAEWFRKIKSDKQKLLLAVDPILSSQEDEYESIYAIADLAGHCTSREPNCRPDMGYAVTVLNKLTEKWNPVKEPEKDHEPTNLLDMVKLWQETDSSNFFSMISEDSRGSIPAQPTGFTSSFTSVDAR